MSLYPPEKAEGNATDYKNQRDLQRQPSPRTYQDYPEDDLPPPYVGSSRPTPSPTPRAQPGGSGGGMMGRFAPGASPADILSAPPPGFNRAPPTSVSYAPFPPCSLLSLSKELASGFPPLAPPAAVSPHPFAAHDVKEEDWTRFLGDVKRAGALSPMNRIVANVAPMAMGIGLVGQ